LTKSKIIKGKETILLIDDEEMILDVGSAWLTSLGYTVITAATGKEAVDIYRDHGDAIDLVVLDMVMPGMGSGETYDRLKTINPNIKVILSSGYSRGKESDALSHPAWMISLRNPLTWKPYHKRSEKYWIRHKSIQVDIVTVQLVAFFFPLSSRCSLFFQWLSHRGYFAPSAFSAKRSCGFSYN
jgi:CheY-like chemotaxis protein